MLTGALAAAWPAADRVAGTDVRDSAGRAAVFVRAGRSEVAFTPAGYTVSDGRRAIAMRFADPAPARPLLAPDGPAAGGADGPLSRVTYRDVWPGVDVEYSRAPGGIMQSTWRIAARSGRVADIRLRYSVPVTLAPSGDLRMPLPDGEWRESRPVAWQEIDGRPVPVPVAFVQIAGDEIGFATGAYDPTYDLVIDPVLTWHTFAGGAGTDSGTSVAVDGSGNVCVVGQSTATWGSPLNAFAGATDAFVARYDASGAQQWITFLGGGGTDNAWGVAVDTSGNVHVTGDSTVTWGSPVNPHGGGTDAFVAKLSPGGLVQWTTFLGAAGNESGYGIVANADGHAFVTGQSTATWGSPVRAYVGGNDAFVARLGAEGGLEWNTFLGGVRNDAGNAIALDGAGHVYVTGASSATWGSPVHAFTLDGYFDVYAAKLTGSGSLVWNTFHNRFSGLNSYGRGIAVGRSGDVYVAGSDTYFYTAAFARKFNASGGHVTRYQFGDALHNVWASGVVVDQADNLYVVGRSNYSWGSPVIGHAGGFDAFVARLCSNFSLQWNTFLGGAGTDHGLGIAMGGSGNLYVTGSSDGAWGAPLNGHAGGTDGFVALVADPQTTSLTVTAPNGGESWIAGSAHDITWTSTGSIATVKIEYSTNNGATWSSVISGTTNDGSFAWSVPNAPTTLARVRISNASDACCGDTNDATFTIAPAIVVTSPNGGESWTMGSTQTVTWTSAGAIANVKIDYSTNNGGAWTPVIASTPNDGSHLWTLPMTPTTQALVRVSDADNASISDVSDAAFTLTLSTITVVSPDGGEVWPTGSDQAIVWTWTGSIASVAIDYSIDGGGAWTPIVASTANTGRYPWHVPAVSTSQCLVRVSDAANGTVTDASNGVFTLDSSPTLVVTAPDGGEIWAAGSAHDILWGAYGSAIANVRIEYSTTNGATWQTIVASTPNDGAFGWTLPSVSSDRCLVRISDAADGSPADLGNGTFTIRQPGAPVSGHWTGATSRAMPVSFDVSADGTQWSNFVLEAPVSSGVGTLVTVAGPGAIVGGSFSVTYASGTFTAAGSFASETAASGTYTFSDYYLGPHGYLNQTGTWAATGPALTVLSPDGGEVWEPGSTQRITWTSASATGDVRIDYSTDNGTSWQTIVASTSNDGVHPWTVPVITSAQCLVRVSAASGGPPEDTSDAVFTIQSAVPLGAALDNTTLRWFSGGHAPWEAQTTTAYFDGDAVQSGAIGHSQASHFSTTVTGPGTLSFYWKVWSEANYDYLTFYIDGTLQHRIAGDVAWAQRTYVIPAGTHTLKWSYTKDSSGVGGADAGWVDKVEYVGPVTISGTVTSAGAGLPGVVMAGLPGSPVTTSAGTYSATVDSGWSGTVTPTLAGHAFSPPTRTYAGVTTDQVDQHYVAGVPLSFTDDPIVPGVTHVRAVHVTELRQRVTTLRTRAALGAYPWTDPTPVTGTTPVRAVHVTELRAALTEAYVALGQGPPSFASGAILPGVTPITAQHIAELRTAVAAIW